MEREGADEDFKRRGRTVCHAQKGDYNAGDGLYIRVRSTLWSSEMLSFKEEKRLLRRHTATIQMMMKDSAGGEKHSMPV